MPVKISSDMPFPMPRSVICSPSHMMKAVPAVSVITHIGMNAPREIVTIDMAGTGQRQGDRKGLDHAQQHGDVTRPLRDLAAAQFAFLLQLGQRLIDHSQQAER